MSNSTPPPAIAAPTAPPAPAAKSVVLPKPGEVITSSWTNNTYTMGDRIGGGHFSDVFACQDVWRNDLAAKVLKPLGTYEHVRANAVAEFEKLRQLRIGTAQLLCPTASCSARQMQFRAVNDFAERRMDFTSS